MFGVSLRNKIISVDNRKILRLIISAFTHKCNGIAKPEKSSLTIIWTTMLPDIDSEPLELILLKRQLANLNCKCQTCAGFPCSPELEHKSSRDHDDKEVQSEDEDPINLCVVYSDKKIGVDPFHNDILCPRCCITMDLLRGNFVKIVKDEESETIVDMSNKSSEITYTCQEKSTSFPNKSSVDISNLSLTDYLTEYSSDLTLPKRGGKRGNNDRVKFVDITHEKPERDLKKPLYGDCSCLENFIESIRPPLVDIGFNKVFTIYNTMTPRPPTQRF